MSDTRKHTSDNDLGTLAEDARDLMAATAEVAGEKVAAARKRLAAALESARKYAVESAKAADEAVRTKPYHAMGIAFGVGAILTYLATRRGSRHAD